MLGFLLQVRLWGLEEGQCPEGLVGVVAPDWVESRMVVPIWVLLGALLGLRLIWQPQKRSCKFG